MNTKILTDEFNFIAPKQLDSALKLIAETESTRILAGGTDVLVKMKMNALPEISLLIDISGIDELIGKSFSETDGIDIGACSRLRDIELDDEIFLKYPILREAILQMASVSIRNMATIGGNIANSSPVADTVPPLIVLSAKLIIRSKDEAREIPIENFFIAPGVNELKSNELITKIRIPVPERNTGTAFLKMGRVASDIAKISFAVKLRRDGDYIEDCRFAMGSVAATPLYLKEIGETVCGKRFSSELLEETAKSIRDFIKPIDDNRTTAEYRLDMAYKLCKDALNLAYLRSGGKVK
ncbi:MAG: xanthine dehydrogenase family protein subunit M [Clostridia bacterium]